MSYLVQFRNLGRDRGFFSVEVESLDEQVLVRHIRKMGFLTSKGIDVVFNPDQSGGIVIVGGFRTVGEFKVSRLNERAFFA